jgi:hypothetical protein
MKNLRLPLFMGFVFALGLILVACGAVPAGSTATPQALAIIPAEEIPVTPTSAEETTPINAPNWWVEEQSKADEQGQVSVVVTPLNLNKAWETIDFRVEMNTHSVDLAMDLATLATITTNSGVTVQAIRWDGPAGGHHVSGTLSFPTAVGGVPVLEGATKLTLTLVEVDVPERVFKWER